MRRDIVAPAGGVVAAIDNRRIARFAKLAGAPGSPTAGLEMRVRLNDRIARGQALFTLHAETAGEMEYATRYVEANLSSIAIAREAA